MTDMLTAQQVVLAATERDARGNAVSPSGPLSWAADNTSLVSLEVSTDGMACTVVSLAAGDVNITVTDPANGLSATSLITISAAPAASMEVAAGVPEDVPAAPAA